MASSNRQIRLATPQDLDDLVGFNLDLARESEGKTLDRETLTAGVRRVLTEPGRGTYFLCVEDAAGDTEKTLGCLMITTEWSDWRNGNFWWIQSVFVRPECRNTGVYRSLHQYVVAAATAAGAVGVRLYVEPENHRAKNTYLALGMAKTYDVMETPPLRA